MLNRLASLAMSSSIFEALPGKLDIKRHSPRILYLYVAFLWAILHLDCRGYFAKLKVKFNANCTESHYVTYLDDGWNALVQLTSVLLPTNCMHKYMVEKSHLILNPFKPSRISQS